jgi:hypothetical protein
MAVRLFCNGLESWGDKFRQELCRQLATLQIDPTLLPVLDVDADPIPPRSVVLYFADSSSKPAAGDLEALKKYIEANVLVIPVLDSTVNATQKLPAILHPFNAFALGAGNYKALVDEVLANTWLARTTRKVFISYKRSDSSGVAHALRDLLTGRNFDVFLDDASIQPGKNFQRELFWWMNDADFVLLLASPAFTSSQWVLQEIQFASLATIGLLAVVWPSTGTPRPAPDVLQNLMQDQLFPLVSADLRGSGAAGTLTDEATSRLLVRLAEVRARLVQRRLLSLLPYLRDNLARKGYTPVPLERLGDLEFAKPGESERSFVRVLPFRPNVEAIDELRDDLSRLAKPPAKAFLFYQENDVKDRRLAALQWLLAPVRGSEQPSTYRLLPYDGAPLLIEDLP